MGNIPADIKIGGNITKDMQEKLLDACEADGAGLEYGAGSSREEIIAAVIQSTKDGQHIKLCNDSTKGELIALTAFCRRYDLPYDARNDGRDEIDAGVEVHRDGESILFCADQAGNPMVSFDFLRAIIDKATADLLVEFDKDDPHEILAEVMDKLRVIAPEIEPLSAIVWEENGESDSSS